MLDTDTKRRIDNCRDILVGKVPDPKSQVEQITIALIYKFMDDMDAEAEELGGKRSFFAGNYEKYGWSKLMAPNMGGFEVLTLYSEAILKMNENPGIPPLFRDIFKNAYLPYRDPETLRSFLKEINTFSYDHSEKLGDAFEYLLSVLGSQGDAGQFRTPRHIIEFIVDIIDPKKDETILDPACGTAGFLISAYKHILRNNSSTPSPSPSPNVRGDLQFQHPSTFGRGDGGEGVARGNLLSNEERKRLAVNIHGYDISPDMVRLSLVNLYLHGFANPRIEEYDTLTSEDKWNEYADINFANPPFMSPKGGIKPHKRFSVQATRSEVLFVDYIAEHLTPTGRAGIIVPEGIIFQSGTAYKTLRKMLVENSLVAVVSLPAGVFNPYSGVKTSVLILDKRFAKKSDSILFAKIDNDGFGLGAQRRAIEKNDLTETITIMKDWINHETSASDGLRRDMHENKNILVVPKEKLAANGDYNLSGERYKVGEQRSSQYSHVELGEVVDILDSLRRPITKCDRKPGPYPYYGATGVLDYVESFLFDEPLVLVGEDGAKWGAGENSAFSVKGKVWVNNHAHVLRPKRDRLLDRFLIEILNEADLMPYVTGVTVPKLNQEKLRSIQIPLPPLEIQKEIVAEIEGYQKVIDGARAVVENYKPHIPIDPDWPMVELGEVCSVNPKKSEIESMNGEMIVSFVPMADLNENEMCFHPKDTKKLSEVTSSYTYFKNNDVLLAKVTPCFENGKAGIARNLVNGIGFGSSEFYVLRAEGRILPELIYLFITVPAFREHAIAQMTGTGGLQRVPRAFVEGYNIPLPHLSTQQSIVAEIEVEQALVNANKELITRFEKKIQATIGRVWGGK